MSGFRALHLISRKITYRSERSLSKRQPPRLFLRWVRSCLYGDAASLHRTLRHTGEKVSLIGVGGYHIGMASDEEESIRIVRTALDNGVNFLGNCRDYNGGVSEVRIGKALRGGCLKGLSS